MDEIPHVRSDEALKLCYRLLEENYGLKAQGLGKGEINDCINMLSFVRFQKSWE